MGGIVERLLGFLETGRDFVTAEAIIQLKDLLRRYPAIAEASLSSVSNIAPEVTSCFSCRPAHMSCITCQHFLLETRKAAQPALQGDLCQCPRYLFIGLEKGCALCGNHRMAGGFGAVSTLQDILEPEARAAFVWILGEYGQSIQVPDHSHPRSACTPSFSAEFRAHVSRLTTVRAPYIAGHACQQLTYTWPVKDAPYLLEPLAEGFAEEAVPVRMALLAAVTKLFFRRPPECQKLLGIVLAAASSDSNQDVHDRALLYYRCST